jgi:hypothetical protein
MLAGVKVRISRASASPEFWKQWTLPRGMLTKSPTPAEIRSSPRRNSHVPSTM